MPAVDGEKQDKTAPVFAECLKTRNPETDRKRRSVLPHFSSKPDPPEDFARLFLCRARS